MAHQPGNQASGPAPSCLNWQHSKRTPRDITHTTFRCLNESIGFNGTQREALSGSYPKPLRRPRVRVQGTEALIKSPQVAQGT